MSGMLGVTVSRVVGVGDVWNVGHYVCLRC